MNRCSLECVAQHVTLSSFDTLRTAIFDPVPSRHNPVTEFDLIDTNHDGRIDRQELETAILQSSASSHETAIHAVLQPSDEFQDAQTTEWFGAPGELEQDVHRGDPGSSVGSSPRESAFEDATDGKI